MYSCLFGDNGNINDIFKTGLITTELEKGIRNKDKLSTVYDFIR